MKKKSKSKKLSFKSKFEQKIANQLNGARVPFDYEPGSFSIHVEKNYWPDFQIGKIYIETKGHLDKDSREKLIAFKRGYPNVDLRIVFQQNNFLHKLSKESRKKRLDKSLKGGKVRERERYSDWAEKHGFKWAVGKIPQEWLDE
jgi:hypothetical protein